MGRAAALIALAFISASCGRPAADVLTNAPATAKSKGTAVLTFETKKIVSSGGRDIVTTSKGRTSIDFTRRRGKTRLNVAGPNGSLRPCDMVSSGAIVYATIPYKGKPPAGAKRWTKIDVAKVTGIDVSSLPSDPAAELDYLKSASEDVTTEGKGLVRGVNTTRYRFSVSTDELLAKLPSDSRERIRAEFANVGVVTVPIDAWVDKDGLPRRIVLDLNGSKPGVAFDVSTKVEIYDYGKPVSITVPAASEVREGVDPREAFANCFGISLAASAR